MWVIMVLGVGCHGAGCGLLGSWMWVIMVLGVDCRGAGCGSSWCWVWVVVELGVGSAPSCLQDTKPSNSLQ